jgi:hypothetical protein
MISHQPAPQVPPLLPQRRMQCWPAADVALVVAAVCYGAAMLLVAAGLFLRLVR